MVLFSHEFSNYNSPIFIFGIIGAEDKRGQSVTSGYESNSWLYLSGHPVVCDRYIEVGAIISSINPSLSMTSACLEIAELQQQLLWLLYDMNHLQRYPMGLGCLGELEEVAPTENRPSCAELYQMAIESARCRYKVLVHVPEFVNIRFFLKILLENFSPRRIIMYIRIRIKEAIFTDKNSTKKHFPHGPMLVM